MGLDLGSRLGVRMRAGSALALLTVSLTVGTVPAQGRENGAPVPQSAQSTSRNSAVGEGPFAYTRIEVRDADTPAGFGGVTIWYPTSTATLRGGIAMSPGFLAPRSNVDPYGQLLASHGFVVAAVDPNSRFADPAERGRVLLATLDWLVSASPARSRVDPARLAVFGHSMGGGGVMEASTRRPTLKAGIAFEPYNDTKGFDTQVPVAVIGGEKDTVAPPNRYAIPIYQRLTSQTKVYLEIAGRDHSVVGEKNGAISAALVAWMKLWVDGDRRYAPLICPGPPVDDVTVSDYRSTCPF